MEAEEEAPAGSLTFALRLFFARTYTMDDCEAKGLRSLKGDSESCLDGQSQGRLPTKGMHCNYSYAQLHPFLF